jgi:hypothetical protein
LGAVEVADAGNPELTPNGLETPPDPNGFATGAEVPVSPVPVPVPVPVANMDLDAAVLAPNKLFEGAGVDSVETELALPTGVNEMVAGASENAGFDLLVSKAPNGFLVPLEESLAFP